MLESGKPIRVACCQLRPRFDDVEGDRVVVREAIREAAAEGAKLIVLPVLCTTGYWFESAAEARGLAQPAARDNIGVSVARAVAHVSRVFVAVCDRWGVERGRRWVGRSTIVDPDGELIAGPPGDRACTLFADCDLMVARDKRWTGTSNDAFADRRPDVYEVEFAAVVSGVAEGFEHDEDMGVG